MLYFSAAETILHAFIHSHLNYCTSLVTTLCLNQKDLSVSELFRTLTTD